MNAPTALTAPHDFADPAAGRIARARGLAGRQMGVLERLAEAGMAVVGAVERDAKAYTAAADAREAAAPDASTDARTSTQTDAPIGAKTDAARAAPDQAVQGLAMAYARAARAVRLTVMLQSKLLRELETVEHEATYALDVRRWTQAREASSAARKARVASIVGRVAGAQDPDQDQAGLEERDDDAREAGEREMGEAVRLEAVERFDEDVYGDVLARPMGEIVARLCADLGLAFDPADWADEAWAQAEAAADDPRSPFAAPTFSGISAPPGPQAGAWAPPWRRPPIPDHVARSGSPSAGRPPGP